MKDIDALLKKTLVHEARTFATNDLAAAEQRFLRGRRKRRFTWFGGATLATAAVVVAVAVFPRPELVKTDEPAPVAAAVTATVRVGETPNAVAAGADGIWVANSGDGTVTRIDPATNERVATIDVGGTPDEVGIGESVVWVARSDDGSVVAIDPDNDEVPADRRIQVSSGGGPARLDLSAAADQLWVADVETGHVTWVTGTSIRRLPGLAAATDVSAALEGPQWIYDGRYGTLRLLVGENGVPVPAKEPVVPDGPRSINGDLARGGGGVWVSDDAGGILRVDEDTLERTSVAVAGTHSDLSFGAGYLWALTASEQDDDIATLRRLDPATGSVVGEPILLRDDPVDVSAANDGVWVAHTAGYVTRIGVGPGVGAERNQS